MSDQLLALSDLATSDKILTVIYLKYTLDNSMKRNVSVADLCRY